MNFDNEQKSTGGYAIPIGIHPGVIALYDPSNEEMESLGLKPAMLGQGDELKIVFKITIDEKDYYQVCKLYFDQKYDFYKDGDDRYVFFTDQHGNTIALNMGPNFDELSFDQQTDKLNSITKDIPTITRLITEAQAPRKAINAYVPDDWHFDSVRAVRVGEIELRHLVIAALGMTAKSRIEVAENMFNKDYCYTFEIGGKKTSLKALLEGKTVYCISTVSMSDNKFYAKIWPGNKYARGWYTGKTPITNTYYRNWVQKIMKSDTPLATAKKNNLVLFGSDSSRVIMSSELEQMYGKPAGQDQTDQPSSNVSDLPF